MADTATIIVSLISGAVGASVGASLTFVYNRANFNRQARLDLLKQRYQEGTKFLDYISSLVDRRFFALQRVLWVIDDSDSDRVARFEKEYFQIVGEWNDSMRTCRNKMRLLVGEVFADKCEFSKRCHPISLNSVTL